MSEPMMIDGFPRRNRVDWATPIERAIRTAIDAVESGPPHPSLTTATIRLSEALNAAADGLEALGQTTPAPRVEVTEAMRTMHDVLRGLRSRNHPDALAMTNALDDIRAALAEVPRG